MLFGCAELQIANQIFSDQFGPVFIFFESSPHGFCYLGSCDAFLLHVSEI